MSEHVMLNRKNQFVSELISFFYLWINIVFSMVSFTENLTQHRTFSETIYAKALWKSLVAIIGKYFRNASDNLAYKSRENSFHNTLLLPTVETRGWLSSGDFDKTEHAIRNQHIGLLYIVYISDEVSFAVKFDF